MEAKRQNILRNLVILLLIVHLSPFMKAANLVIAGIIIWVLVSQPRAQLLKKFRELIRNKVFWALIAPVLLLIVSLSYSTNGTMGVKLLEIRSTLFIFPLILSLADWKKETIISCVKAFIVLMGIAVVVSGGYQAINYLNSGDIGLIYSDNLVALLNKQAVYFGIFINLAFLFSFLLWKAKAFSNTEKKINVLIIVLLLIAQYLLASRIALLTTAGIGGIALINSFLQQSNKQKKGVLIVGTLAVIVGLIVAFPKVVNRFKSVLNTTYEYSNENPINHINGEIKKENWNGLNTRLALWNCGWEEVKKSPIIGHGLGDVQDRLTANYQQKNFVLALNSGYNVHNQYLDFLLTGGVFGGVILFGYFLIPFVEGWKQQNWWLVGTIAILALAGLTENIFGRNQGVILIALFTSLFSLKQVFIQHQSTG